MVKLTTIEKNILETLADKPLTVEQQNTFMMTGAEDGGRSKQDPIHN